jgi:hypothetical protein
MAHHVYLTYGETGGPRSPPPDAKAASGGRGDQYPHRQRSGRGVASLITGEGLVAARLGDPL